MFVRAQSEARPAASALLDLSANENPHGPSPLAVAAIREAALRAHRYPDREGSALKLALARRHGLSVDHFALGNGSCEVLEAIARATLGPGDRALVVQPSFPAYRSAIARAGATVATVELGPDPEDLSAVAAQICGWTRLVVLANPNNPTGVAFGAASWRRFLASVPPGVLVAIDEAYGEYVLRPDYPQTLEAVAAGRPVAVVRSFSKAYGLAGLRLGYVAAAPPLARRTAAQLQQFNTNAIAQAAALAALADEDHLGRCVAQNAAGRAFLERSLRGLGLSALPSEANFLLVSAPGAPAICRGLRERGVLVKPLDTYGLPDAFRVSVGTTLDNERFVDALSAILAEPAGDGARREVS